MDIMPINGFSMDPCHKEHRVNVLFGSLYSLYSSVQNSSSFCGSI